MIRWAVFLCAGCAAAPLPEPAKPDTRSLDAALAEHDAETRSAVSARTLEPLETRIIAPPPPTADRPVGIRKHVDVRFHDADLADVARMLGDAGRFPVVTSGALTQKVSVDLKRVHPYEALVAIAEAHGCSVTRRGDIVVIRGPH